MSAAPLLRRPLGAALALWAAALAGPAAAQVDLPVALSPAAPPLANAVTQAEPSSLSLDVTNLRAGTTVTQLALTLPKHWTSSGGAAPEGWTVVGVSEKANDVTVTYRVATCGQGGLAAGARGTFRIDMVPLPPSSYGADTAASLSSVAASDPCGGSSGWTPTSPVAFTVKVLSVSAAVAPLSGASPLAAAATFTVANRSTASKTVLLDALTVTASPGASWLQTAPCTPASLALASGASGTFACPFSLTAAPGAVSSFAFAAGARSSPAGSSAVGASAGPVLAGAATATFAFDTLAAPPGGEVRATLSVTNQTAGAVDVAPPSYAQLSLQNLQRMAGAPDPAPALAVPPGATRSFVYALAATGVVGASYLASGTAQTTAGPSNLAVTPPGTVTGWAATWSPAAVVASRASPPYGFVVTVQRIGGNGIGQIDLVNPQNGAFTGLAHVSVTATAGSTMAYSTRHTSGSTDTLRYVGSLAIGGKATIAVSFTGIPSVATTARYPFRISVYGIEGGTGTIAWPFGTATRTVAVTVPIPDVAGLGILSDAAGQTLFWTNTSGPETAHDGVVVFRTPAGATPPLPVDGTDYTAAPGAIYADKWGSAVATLADPTPGAFNYRVCNHDASFVYSGCSSGFWNGAGWLDSAPAPAGGWTQQLGGAVYLYPGVIPGGRVGVATNAPAAVVLDAATGRRPFDPVALSGLPSSGTPAAPLGNGRLVLFAADNGGSVTALDIQTGAVSWRATWAGESFVAGVSGALRRYAAPAFQAAYSTDVLFLGSTSGRLLAVDAWSGATLWTLGAGAPIRAPSYYDAGKNWLYVHTDGAGIQAWDLGTSGPATPPVPAAGFASPSPTGAYTLGCTGGPAAGQLACVDRAGLVQLVDGSTGAVAASRATGLSTPVSLWSVGGGLVLSNAAAVQRLAVSGATVALAGSWAPPGAALSPVQVFGTDPATGAPPGAIYVGGSDLKLHKLRLADAGDTGLAFAVTSPAAGTRLAPLAFDVANGLFLFGADDGRLWAVRPF